MALTPTPAAEKRRQRRAEVILITLHALEYFRRRASDAIPRLRELDALVADYLHRAIKASYRPA